MISKRQTAGELSLKAANDQTVYDSLEVGYALTEDIAKQLELCVQAHDPIFDMDQYCVVMVIAGDPMIKNVMRRKFYGYPYLPSPRPNQTVFLYSKRQQKFLKRLWVLPAAIAMETLYETVAVAPQYASMKAWSHAFYDGTFWEYIRGQHDIDMLSETEYLNANREKLIKAGCKQIDSSFSDPFDFSKVTVNQVVNSNAPVLH